MSIEGIHGTLLFKTEEPVVVLLTALRAAIDKVNEHLYLKLRGSDSIDHELLEQGTEKTIAESGDIIYLAFDRSGADGDEGSIMLGFRFDRPGYVGVYLNFNLYELIPAEVDRLWEEARGIFTILAGVLRPAVAQLNGMDSDEDVETLVDLEDLEKREPLRILAPVNVFAEEFVQPEDLAMLQGTPGMVVAREAGFLSIAIAAPYTAPPPAGLLKLRRWPASGRPVSYIQPQMPKRKSRRQ